MVAHKFGKFALRTNFVAPKHGKMPDRRKSIWYFFNFSSLAVLYDDVHDVGHWLEPADGLVEAAVGRGHLAGARLGLVLFWNNFFWLSMLKQNLWRSL